MSDPVSVAVFPVAGRGSRFLPATKASPKEMLPIVDKPLIQYAVEEALRAGARSLVFVTGRAKRAIEDHFDRDHQLEQELEAHNKHELLASIRDLVPANAGCIYIRQSAPLGLGHAVLSARPVVGRRPFFVHLADDLISGELPCLSQLQTHFAATGASTVAVQPIPADQTDRYGIVAMAEEGAESGPIRAIVEKPAPADAPSNLAVVGRYVLTPAIFDLLEATGRGAGGEIQLTDGIARLIDSEPVHALSFEGRRFDCGNKLGYLKATVAFALAHPTVGDSFAAHLREVVRRLDAGD